MEARDMRDRTEILPGITLVRSTLGGFSIEADGDYLGWIHASSGDYWNAYLRVPGAEGRYLGRFHPQTEAARHIVEASGRPTRRPVDAPGPLTPTPTPTPHERSTPQ
jgi:hypothetical protein